MTDLPINGLTPGQYLYFRWQLSGRYSWRHFVIYQWLQFFLLVVVAWLLQLIVLPQGGLLNYLMVLSQLVLLGLLTRGVVNGFWHFPEMLTCLIETKVQLVEERLLFHGQDLSAHLHCWWENSQTLIFWGQTYALFPKKRLSQQQLDVLRNLALEKLGPPLGQDEAGRIRFREIRLHVNGLSLKNWIKFRFSRLASLRSRISWCLGQILSVSVASIVAFWLASELSYGGGVALIWMLFVLFKATWLADAITCCLRRGEALLDERYFWGTHVHSKDWSHVRTWWTTPELLVVRGKNYWLMEIAQQDPGDLRDSIALLRERLGPPLNEVQTGALHLFGRPNFADLLEFEGSVRGQRALQLMLILQFGFPLVAFLLALISSHFYLQGDPVRVWGQPAFVALFLMAIPPVLKENYFDLLFRCWSLGEQATAWALSESHLWNCHGEVADYPVEWTILDGWSESPRLFYLHSRKRRILVAKRLLARDQVERFRAIIERKLPRRELI